jgi:hypothetical protein
VTRMCQAGRVAPLRRVSGRAVIRRDGGKQLVGAGARVRSRDRIAIAVDLPASARGLR